MGNCNNPCSCGAGIDQFESNSPDGGASRPDQDENNPSFSSTNNGVDNPALSLPIQNRRTSSSVATESSARKPVPGGDDKPKNKKNAAPAKKIKRGLDPDAIKLLRKPTWAVTPEATRSKSPPLKTLRESLQTAAIQGRVVEGRETENPTNGPMEKATTSVANGNGYHSEPRESQRSTDTRKTSHMSQASRGSFSGRKRKNQPFFHNLGRAMTRGLPFGSSSKRILTSQIPEITLDELAKVPGFRSPDDLILNGWEKSGGNDNDPEDYEWMKAIMHSVLANKPIRATNTIDLYDGASQDSQSLFVVCGGCPLPLFAPMQATFFTWQRTGVHFWWARPNADHCDICDNTLCKCSKNKCNSSAKIYDIVAGKINNPKDEYGFIWGVEDVQGIKRLVIRQTQPDRTGKQRVMLKKKFLKKILFSEMRILAKVRLRILDFVRYVANFMQFEANLDFRV